MGLLRVAAMATCFLVAAGALPESSRSQMPPPGAPIVNCSAYFARAGEKLEVDAGRGLLAQAYAAQGVKLSVEVVRTNFAGSRLDLNAETGAFTLDAPSRRFVARITYRVRGDNGLSSLETDYLIGLERNPNPRACPYGPHTLLGEHHWWGAFKGEPIPLIEPKLRVSKGAKRWRFIGRVAGACRARRGYSDDGDFLFRPRLKGRVGFQKVRGEQTRILLSPKGAVHGRAPDGRAFVARFETFKSWVDTRINPGTGKIRSRWRVGFVWSVKCAGARAFEHQRNAYAYEQ